MGCSDACEVVETGASTGDKELMAEAEADLVGLAMPRDVPKSKPGKPVEFLVERPSFILADTPLTFLSGCTT